MKRHLHIVLISLFFLTAILHHSASCEVVVDWQYDLLMHVAYDLKKTSDDGFILATTPASLIKLDSLGNEVWNKSYVSGTPNIDEHFSNGAVIETQDGGFVAVGYQLNYATGDYLLFILKTDSDGNEKWRKIFFGSDGYIFGRSVCETKAGDLVVTGLDNTHGEGNLYGGGVYLLKLDAEGNEVWIKYYENDARAVDIRETKDGDFILAGDIQRQDYKLFMHVFKTNSDGDIVWSKTFDEYSQGKAVRETEDSDFVVAASGNGNLGASLVKIDNDGNNLWSKQYDGLDIVESFEISQDGRYVMVGTTNYSSSRDLGLLKTDSFGNEIWREAISGYPRGYGLCPIGDYRYVVYGNRSGHNYVISIERPEPNISVSHNSYDFGAIAVGKSSDPLNIIISNDGGKDLNVSAIILSDGSNYSLSGDTSAIIESANSHTVTVTFIPQSAGTFQESITITSNDPDTPSVDVQLISESFLDSDDDGIPDDKDKCPYDPDNNIDGDGICGDLDNCPLDPNKVYPGLCGCGVADTDSDNDHIPNCFDNCPLINSLDQSDFDGDGVGDVCDPDDDNDGMPDWWEVKYGLNPLLAIDAEQDNDRDEFTNIEEYGFSTDPNIFDKDEDGNGIPDVADKRRGAIIPTLTILLLNNEK